MMKNCRSILEKICFVQCKNSSTTTTSTTTITTTTFAAITTTSVGAKAENGRTLVDFFENILKKSLMPETMCL